MPTLNKLEYLDATKQQIKNALNQFGAGITSDDTFRSYVSKISDIYNNWARVEGEGTSLNLTPTKKGKMSLKPVGNTTQEDTPTPDNPVPIKKVTGNNSIIVCGKNLFNLNDTYYQNQNGTVTISGKTITLNKTYAYNEHIWWNIPVNVGTTYTISYEDIEESTTNANNRIEYVYNDTPILDYTGLSSLTRTPINKTSKTATSTSTGKYLILVLRAGNGELTNKYIGIQVVVGSTTPTNCVPYQSQTYPINLGSLELCEIGDYSDEFYLDNGNWYVEKNTAKIDSYNGETITTQYISTTGGLDTGATVYYGLSTPTYTEITDTTLITQLNNLLNATSYSTQTNITQVNADAPFNIKASALMKGGN